MPHSSQPAASLQLSVAADRILVWVALGTDWLRVLMRCLVSNLIFQFGDLALGTQLHLLLIYLSRRETGVHFCHAILRFPFESYCLDLKTLELKLLRWHLHWSVKEHNRIEYEFSNIIAKITTKRILETNRIKGPICTGVSMKKDFKIVGGKCFLDSWQELLCKGDILET